MLTYLLQERIYRATESKKLEFPNKLTVTVKLGPATVFGAGTEYSRLVVHESKANILWNSNTGKVLCKCEPPLKPLEAVVESPESRFALSGNVLTYELNCESEDHLIGCLQGLQYVFPAFLNIKFPDPPFVEQIRCNLGGLEFNWEHNKAIYSFTPLTEEILEKHVVDFFELLPLVTGVKNRRLVAAIYYFYTGSRLLVSGHSQWEFMAECILNFHKTLEILFGRNRDSIRTGLEKLGYETDEIEGDFIPLDILRSVLDVAHPRIAIFPQETLTVLYSYLSKSETRFRKLIEKAVHAVRDGGIELEQDESLELDSTEKEKLRNLVDILKVRNPL